MVITKTEQLFLVRVAHLLFMPDCFQDSIIHMTEEGTYCGNGLHQDQNDITSLPHHSIRLRTFSHVTFTIM